MNTNRRSSDFVFPQSHCGVALDARMRGVEGGDFTGSLLDNLERDSGHLKRFDLVYVDYPTLQWSFTKWFDWFRNLVRADGLPECI